jgi:hypothetical protein
MSVGALLTNQNMFFTIPICVPCFLLVECVALSDYHGGGSISMYWYNRMAASVTLSVPPVVDGEICQC